MRLSKYSRLDKDEEDPNEDGRLADTRHSKRARMSPRAGDDDRPMESQMAMNRKATRDNFEANDIAKPPVDQAAVRRETQEKLDSVQSTMKPIRQSNRTFKNEQHTQHGRY